MVRESHALIDGSAAESGGAAEKCHSRRRRHSPDCRPAEPPNELLLEYRQDFFLVSFFHLNCLLLMEIHNMKRLCSRDSN